MISAKENIKQSRPTFLYNEVSLSMILSYEQNKIPVFRIFYLLTYQCRRCLIQSNILKFVFQIWNYTNYRHYVKFVLIICILPL